jgi:hypothetical protein
MISRYHFKMCMCEPCEVIAATENRDGLDITAADALEVMQKQTNSGWQLSRFKPICVQRPVDEKLWPSILLKAHTAASIDGGLPTVNLDKVNYVGLAGNTTNTGWRMVLQRKVLDSYISESVDGQQVLSIERLAEFDADQAATCRTGAPWTVLSSDIWTNAPEALNIIQKAENLVGQVVNMPGWIDGIRRANNLVLRMDTDDSVTSLHGQMPNLKESEIESIVHFAEKMGGDKSKHFDLWLHLANHFVPGRRRLTPTVLDAVVGLSVSIPLVTIAIVHSALLCPVEQVGMASLLGSAGVIWWL